MCIGPSAMITNLSNANNKPKKILKPVKVQDGKKIIAKTKKTLTILELLSTFLISVKAEHGAKVRLGTQAFISILKHSKNCRYDKKYERESYFWIRILTYFRSCEDVKCKKMKMVLSHFSACSKLKNGDQCSLCSQLLKVVAQHSLYLCPHDGLKKSCAVPFCDLMRAAKALKN